MKKYVEPKAETAAFDTEENICGLDQGETLISAFGGRYCLDLEEQSLDRFNDMK